MLHFYFPQFLLPGIWEKKMVCEVVIREGQLQDLRAQFPYKTTFTSDQLQAWAFPKTTLRFPNSLESFKKLAKS